MKKRINQVICHNIRDYNKSGFCSGMNIKANYDDHIIDYVCSYAKYLK